MSVASPALAAWHRKFVGEAARRCMKPLAIYEDMPCFCFLGHPPRTREPCPKGHCQNINGMPRKVMDVAIAYSNERAELEDIETVRESRLCYSGPSWIKVLMSLMNPPHVVLCFRSPFSALDRAVTDFLESYV